MKARLFDKRYFALNFVKNLKNFSSSRVFKFYLNVFFDLRNKVLDKDIVTLSKSNSESILAGIDVQDPEESDMLEDDIPEVPVATNQLVTA